MNIKEAKEQIKNAMTAYFTKDEFGSYAVPVEKQRPVFLMGPPGIGKTAIMEQIAQELDVCLVSYSMTHHTRQSALGLPFIEKKVFNGKEYQVSEYTMSEIIASVYETMEATGKKEGIPLKGSRRRIPQLCTNCNLFSALFDSSMQKKRPHSGACFFGHAVIFFVSAELLALPLLGTQCPASGPGCRIPQPLGAAGGPASHWCGQAEPARAKVPAPPERLNAGRSAPTLHSLSHHLEHNVPHPVPGVALDEGQVLPGPYSDFAVHKRHRDEGGQQRRLDVGGAIVVMPGLMMPVRHHPPLLIQIGGEHIQRRLQVVVHNARLELQGRQARHAAGGEAGDRPGRDAVLPACLLHCVLKVLRHVDHAHVGLGVVCLFLRVNCHLPCLLCFLHCNTVPPMLQWEKSIPRPPAGERRQPPMECGIVTVDLHGRNTYQAKVTVDALLRRAGAGTYRLRLIHGCHQGTALRDFLQVEYGHHPQVKRLLRSPDGGATDLVLRE